MKLELHYVDPRLVALYDAANPRGADTAFYLRLADRLAAQVIVDLGCGTGRSCTAPSPPPASPSRSCMATGRAARSPTPAP